MTSSKKAADLDYGVDDNPPLRITLPLAFQQVVIISIDLIFPVLIVQAVMGSIHTAQSFVSLTMLALGAGTLLQSLNRGPVGSGYFCPHEAGALYYPASVLAAQKGGLPLVLGMTVLAGLAEVFFAKVIHRVRFLLPPELAGLVVVMLGVTLIPVSITNFSGSSGDGTVVDLSALSVGAMTLGVMVGANVWGKGAVRQYSVLIGMIGGYLASYATGSLTGEHLARLSEVPLVAAPDISHVGWAFDPAMALPFLVAVVCSSLKTVGNITTCQKANDPEWKRLEMKSARGGLLTEGLATTLSGLVGGMGHNTSSGSIGLAIATGVTSRRLGVFVGLMFIALAFLPKAAALVAIMPKPVMGATLIVVICFVTITGFQIILSRMLDARKIFIIGLALVFGLSVSMVPGLYRALPAWLQPFFDSAFSLATVTAIVLNLLFRIGVKQRKAVELEPGVAASAKVFEFLESAGASWGARRDVIHRAESALTEFMESSAALGLVDGKVQVAASFDEYNVNLDLSYAGQLMEFAEVRPSKSELLEDDAAFIRLSGFIVRQYADQIKASRNEGLCRIRLHFDH
ncbi:uracil-xanthine permease family protein [Anaeroselena agilis]|uniref:Solute carrier family 23 protein n=1 Tax=Anaeroselena agilis TaxID=3063788 RepID=A0ABU3P3H0_9FIRM|nr:solute carrier family 23 protein [Selenomonadales bacterium 4137-cl]